LREARRGASRVRQHRLGFSRRDGVPLGQRPPIKSGPRSQDRAPSNQAARRRRPPLSDHR
jgi:hypothetical protein